MKSLDEVYLEVTEFISQKLNYPTTDMSSESSISDLTNDSIQLFELLIAFEKYYGVEAAYEDVINMHTVGDIVKYIFENKYSK